jgi:hypothetical protein
MDAHRVDVLLLVKAKVPAGVLLQGISSATHKQFMKSNMMDYIENIMLKTERGQQLDEMLACLTTYRVEMLGVKFNPNLDHSPIINSLVATEPPRHFIINDPDTGKQLWPPLAGRGGEGYADYRQVQQHCGNGSAGGAGVASTRAGFGELVGDGDGVILSAPTSKQVQERLETDRILRDAFTKTPQRKKMPIINSHTINLDGSIVKVSIELSPGWCSVDEVRVDNNLIICGFNGTQPIQAIYELIASLSHVQPSPPFTLQDLFHAPLNASSTVDASGVSGSKLHQHLDGPTVRSTIMPGGKSV